MKSGSAGSPRVIALCGKGGVGKTAVAAVMVKILASNPRHRVLAVDADPASGLAAALGIEVRKTVDDIRCSLIRGLRAGRTGSRAETAALLDYEVFSTLEERGNLAFLAIGRPESDGCYCQVNHVLKDIIASLAQNFDYVVIDGEAGIEQVNRRVMERVTHLVLVSDASAKGLRVAGAIRAVAAGIVPWDTSGLVLNRIRDRAERSRVALPLGIDCIGWIPEDETIRSFDMADTSLLGLPDCPALTACAGCLAAMGLTQAP